MKRKIKIRGEFHWDFKDFFVTNILSKKHKLIRVEKNPDITIGLVEPTPLTSEFRKSPKKLLVSGENLYYKINLFKLLEYFTKKTGIKLDVLNKIIPRRVLNISLGLMRRQYYNYVKSLSKKKSINEYAIICNDIKGSNILNLPFFFQVNKIVDSFDRLKNKSRTDLSKRKKFCCIIFGNGSAFDRISFFEQLSKYKKVDCFSGTKYANAKSELLSNFWEDNSEFYSQYKFVICFENSFKREYITEKLPNVMLDGPIPIYRGAQNVNEYFDTKSFINYDDYGKSYAKMIEKIIELDQDDVKYKEFVSRPWMNKKNILKMDKKQKELKMFLDKMIDKD